MQQTADVSHLVESPAQPTGRDEQRGALAQLVRLVEQCATEQLEIQQTLTRSLQRLDKQLKDALWEIDQRYDRQEKQYRTRHQESVEKINADVQAETQRLARGLRSAVQSADHELDKIEQEVKQHLQQARWMADSILEVAQNRIRESYDKSREEARTHDEALDAMRQRALQLLEDYGCHRLIEQTPPLAAPDPSTLAQGLDEHRLVVERRLQSLRRLVLPRLFVGLAPYLIVVVLLALILAGAHLLSGRPAQSPDVRLLTIAGGIGLAVLVGLGLGLQMLGKSQVRRAYEPFLIALDQARRASLDHMAAAEARRDAEVGEATARRDTEVKAVKDKHAPVLDKARSKREQVVQKLQEEHNRKLAALQQRRDQAIAEADAWLKRHLDELIAQRQSEIDAARTHHASQTISARSAHDQRWKTLQQTWEQGLKWIQAPIDAHSGLLVGPLEESDWSRWEPAKHFASSIRFGELQVDVKPIIAQVVGDQPFELPLPGRFGVPALLAFPRQASLLIQHDRDGRSRAIETLQLVMARLLTSLPAGRVRFTLIDPVGLGQNFAGFMHLADYDEALVGLRIWTDQEHIEQRLADLTEHMETVIQKYLRNEFATIDDYNAQAGELAEPYRFLVIADLPVNFSDDAIRRLNSIASTGARCGVYTLIARDRRQNLPGGAHLDEVQLHSVNLVQQGDRFVWEDQVFRKFPLILDTPPGEETLTAICRKVGKEALANKRVEVPFEMIAPGPDQLWTLDASTELRVPIGRMGATRLQNLRLGRGVAQHVLIAGKTGSGKSTLLHVLVTNLALWYSPDQVEFYLIDFKKGVEFKTYATHALPHVRAIAVESDREFGLSVLQRIDAELTRRGELFRKAGVQDLAAYRAQTGQNMPRTLLIIDEFQEFFSEDDKLSQDAAVLLDRLVRQGRAFGIHVLLGSQTIGGTSGLSRSTLGQMAIRIALQTSEADSQLILGDNNSAARLLNRPGEAIYNDQGGLVEGNSPFQIAWLNDDQRETYLARVQEKTAAAKLDARPPAVVFEGNAPADVRKNVHLVALLSGQVKPPVVPHAWIGEPVAIKEPTAIVLRRQSGANALIIGQYDEQAVAILSHAMISLALQHGTDGCQFVVLDGSPVDSPLAGVLRRVGDATRQPVQMVEYRAVEQAIVELGEQLKSRQGADRGEPPPIYVIIYGLQRYRALRKQEESYSFSMDDTEPKKPAADKVLAELLRDGPSQGIHVLAWCDTPASVERTLDRTVMREFDYRILFQMSANDSSNLIDSPAANKLGMFRALAYSEEQGTLEKFRPYALPDAAWLKSVAARSL